MDTKSKSTNLTRGIFSWFCYLLFFFSSIFVCVYGYGIFSTYGSDIFIKAESAVNACGNVIRGELRELSVYKENASNFFERLYYITSAQQTDTSAAENTDSGAETASEVIISNIEVPTVYVDTISKDNLYSVTDYSSDPAGVTVTNDTNWDSTTLPEGFNYLFQYRDGVVEIYYKENGDILQVFSSDEPGAFYTNTLSYTLEALRTVQRKPDIIFAVREEPTSFYASNEIVSSTQTYANQLLFQMVLISIAAILFLLILILGIVFRRDRRLFETCLAHGLKWLWVEIKVFVALVALGISYLLIFSSGTGELRGGLFTVSGLFIVFLLIHFLRIDLSHNRHIWRHNIIHSILKFFSGPRHGKRFEQIEYRKYTAVVSVLVGLAVVMVLVTLIAWGRWPFQQWLPAFYTAVGIAALGTLLWYAAVLREDLQDYSALMDQVEQMYNGDLTAVNNLSATSPLYSSAMQLNMIRDGIKIAVEEGIKSERTKVELITNVSHDIKTPLTSIIGYVELLKAEPDLPPHVQDYIGIISQKSDRLRHMIQDIFDVSKAATGNITLEPEHLYLDKLLQQTLADMDELMQSSPLHWRVQIPEDSFPVYVDGQRMYRVFQNLIKNAAQYALDGSRVYISLIKQEQTAYVIIQNISKYELQTDGETLTGRFVRGDDSRSTSGSGLGLSIAKGFTEACGGTCTVHVQGDLFTVEIALPIISIPEPAEQPNTERETNTAEASLEESAAEAKEQ